MFGRFVPGQGTGCVAATVNNDKHLVWKKTSMNADWLCREADNLLGKQVYGLFLYM